MVSRSLMSSRLFSAKYVRDIVWWNWHDMTFDCWLGECFLCCVALPCLIAVLTESCAKIILESIRNPAFVCARHVYQLKTIRAHKAFNESKRTNGAVQIHRNKLTWKILRANVCGQTIVYRVNMTPKNHPLTLVTSKCMTTSRLLLRVPLLLIASLNLNHLKALFCEKFPLGFEEIFVCSNGIDSSALSKVVSFA